MGVATLNGDFSSKFIFATKRKIVAKATASLWAGYYFDWKLKLFLPNELAKPLSL